MDNKQISRTTLGVAIIGGLLSMPVGASAIVVQFLGQSPNFSAQTAWGQDAHLSNWVDYFAWWNIAGANVSAGPNGWSPYQTLGGVGPFRTYAGTYCANGSSVSTGWIENQGRISATCPPGVNSSFGMFGVDVFPYGS